ncbi:hypothetical protein CA235_18420 [Sphingomonas sp. ABOLF]|nr:hypothetical protein CA235_18420 [Sphingomonas sp. ABOLF]
MTNSVGAARAAFASEKRCADAAARSCGCGKPIGPKNQTGYCRSCCARAKFHAPGVRERRLESIRRNFADPAYRAAHAERLRIASSTPKAIAARRQRGREQYRDVLSRPDVLARTQSPDARQKRGASITEARLGWCPADRREEYRVLIMTKKIPAAEARRIIEAEIAGTLEHGRREIASNELAARLRHERQQREAY